MGSDLDKVDIFQTDSVVQLCEGIWEDTEIVKNKIESLPQDPYGLWFSDVFVTPCFFPCLSLSTSVVLGVFLLDLIRDFIYSL